MAMKIIMGMILILVLGCAGVVGCNADTTDRGKLEDLEFTVVGEHDVPQTLQDL